MDHSPRDSHASQVCLRCKKHKRKCGKELPTCSLCERLGQVCYYRTAAKTFNNEKSLSLLALGLPNLYQLTQSGITDAVRTRGQATIGDDKEVLKTASYFFETIHTWFPVISRPRYYEQMAVVWNQPNPDFGLLALATFLLTCAPEHQRLTNQTSSLYTFMKSIIGALESTGFNTLELVHARLLITIFEAGHGITHAAYISMGSSIRAAAALGLDNIHANQTMFSCLNPPVNVKDAEQTWRGIMCLDKYLSLELQRPSGDFRTRLSPGDILSEDHISPNHYNIVTRYDIEFTMLFQVTHILDQVLAHVYNPLPQEEFNTSEAIQLLSTLESLKALLTGKSFQRSGLYDAMISLCYSTSVTLFAFWANLQRPNNESCVLSAESFMACAVEDILDHFQHLDYDRSAAVLDSLPIFVSQSIFKAGEVLVHELKHTTRLDVRKSIVACKRVLGHIAKRWLVGSRSTIYPLLFMKELAKKLLRTTS
ncbi:hypothetical protein DPV78_008118 [Talaromyces pinophilus]|nr:hypothetical protein DPV78_008118 [Talaromyces pinophilus]